MTTRLQHLAALGFVSDVTGIAKGIESGHPGASTLKAANRAAGVIFHYPALQVQRAVQGVAALERGRTKNPGVLVVGSAPRR